MKINEIIIRESRVRSMERDAHQIVELLLKNCSDAIKGSHLYRGRYFSIEKFGYFDQKLVKNPREAANTSNYFNLLISNSPNWDNWPKRNRSILGSTSYEQSRGYGSVSIVFPFNNVKIALSPNHDFWESFPELETAFGYSFNDVDQINMALEDIASHFEIQLNEFQFNIFESQMKEIQNRLKTTDLKSDKDFYEYYQPIIEKLLKYKDPMKFLFKITDPKLNNFKLFTTKNLEFDNEYEWWTEGPAYLVDYRFFRKKVEPLLKHGR